MKESTRRRISNAIWASLTIICLVYVSVKPRDNAYAAAENVANTATGGATGAVSNSVWYSKFYAEFLIISKNTADALAYYNTFVTAANQTLALAEKTANYLEKLKNIREAWDRQVKQVENFLSNAFRKGSIWYQSRFRHAPSQLSMILEFNALLSEFEALESKYETLFCRKGKTSINPFCDGPESEMARVVSVRHALNTKATTSIHQSERYLSNLQIDRELKMEAIDSSTDGASAKAMVKEVVDRMDALELQKHQLKQQIETNKLLVAIYNRIGDNVIEHTPYGNKPLTTDEIKKILEKTETEGDYLSKPEVTEQ